ncbi:hypothetical protein ACFVMC_07605 [Nocardia sp. NPDC127579]|uniref:hypothetical protein n=1 Tax=Nocardia sp. NPDC127579 TaxID=3345402 RepID=UPI00362A0298
MKGTPSERNDPSDPGDTSPRLPTADFGDPACLLSEICPECGRVLSDMHATGCPHCRPDSTP